ncbi:MAG: SDR family oxidoreductase [Bacteroidota bacterium]
MKVLFIGGTGVISTAVSQLAVEKGIELYIFNRGISKELFPIEATFIKGDINDLASAKSLLGEHEFDVVVDWIAFTPNDIKRDIELFKGRTKQFVFISSASVYQKPLEHYLITESTPASNPFWDYAANKILCEELLKKEYSKSGFPYTIVRPSFTYGVTRIPAIVTNNNMPMTLIDRMRKGKKVIVPGDGSSLWIMTHNTDFAKGFVGLVGNENAIGEVFHITSDEVLTWDQIINTIGEVAGAELNIVHIPTDLINHYAPNIGEGLLGDKSTSVVFDNSKIKKFVPDFDCTVSYKKGITRSLRWLENHEEYCGIDHETNAIVDNIILKYESAFD